MQLATIHEHTVDLDLLTGNVVIDAGCLGFEFSEAMAERGMYVLAFDVQPFDQHESNKIKYTRAAVGNFFGKVNYKYNERDPQATCLSVDGVEVDSVDIFQCHADHWKLDIEGAEYTVLTDGRLSAPISTIHLPKQITVEFHEHCQPIAHSMYFEQCMQNLSHNYVPVQHERTAQHGAGFNYWDSLFIRKDLI